LADAKARLSELVDSAAAGDSVLIIRRGKPVAQIGPVEKPYKPIDAAALRAVTYGMPKQTEPAAVIVRRMRDEDRY
jgi:prevent-host-death family protein